MRQAEAAKETEREVGDFSELEARDAVEDAEQQAGGCVGEETAADRGRDAAVTVVSGVAVAVMEPDDRVVLQVVNDGDGRDGRLPAQVGKRQPVKRDDGGE